MTSFASEEQKVPLTLIFISCGSNESGDTGNVLWLLIVEPEGGR